MKSHEALRKAIHPVGVKSVAADMNLSASLIYKWCQDNESPDAPGADNPLDRLRKVSELTNSVEPIRWLCHQFNAYMVANPPLVAGDPTPILQAAQELLNNFSELLAAVSVSMENDGKIDLEEADAIRQQWEALKSATETFVVACENGQYNKLEP